MLSRILLSADSIEVFADSWGCSALGEGLVCSQRETKIFSFDEYGLVTA